MYLKMLLALFIVGATIPIASQVAPQGSREGIPFTVGLGYSNYYSDWNGRIQGSMFWLDWDPDLGTSYLRGVGIEVEGRDLNYGRSGRDTRLRMDTAAGGAIYKWHHFNNFRPYAKFLAGFGSADFTSSIPNYTHDTRTVLAPGGGLEYRVFRGVWVRGNYEYQFWPDLFRHHALTPNGFTIGASYDLQGKPSTVR